MKYIEAEALKAFMRGKLTGNDLYTPNGIEEFVDGLPDADVVKRVYRGRRPSDDLVKVVRCRECKHRKLCEEVTFEYKGKKGYCSRGEKE